MWNNDNEIVMIDKNKSLLQLSLIMLLLLLAGKIAMMFLFPDYTAKAHLAVPVYFWLFYTVAIISLPTRLDCKMFARRMLLFKVAKMTVSLFVLFFIALFSESQAKGVIINFLVYYLLLMIPENYCVLSIKKKML